MGRLTAPAPLYKINMNSLMSPNKRKEGSKHGNEKENGTRKQ